MKLKLSHRIRYHIGCLRRRTPHFNGEVKHFVWGIGEKAKETDVIPSIIWLYWDDEKISSMTVKLCIDKINHLHPDYTIHLLNRINLTEYLPDFPSQLLDKAANFTSDLVRLMLLERHGGIYLDATVLLSKRLDWVISLQGQDRSEVVLYYTDENTVEDRYPMVETWFIAAMPQSSFIKAWREEYQDCILSSKPEKYYENNDILPLSKFPMDITYYFSYMAGQIAMRRNSQYRLSLLRAEDDAYLYSLRIKRKWSEMAMTEILLLNKKNDQLPNLVKIIRFARRRLDFCIQRSFYKKDSWLGGMLKDRER